MLRRLTPTPKNAAMKAIIPHKILILSALVLSLAVQSVYGFVKGADVGWLTQMEASGKKFYNSSGTQQDLFQILKGYNINAIRLRVWVNPSGGWCNQADVITKAVRAKNAGMQIMIDFHYSDTWADPGHQTKPAAWSSHGISALYTDVWQHTTNVLNALKSAGITPTWVQVGNETNNGMLWSDGKASVSMSNFAGLITSGYNGVKQVFPNALVVVHLANGYDNSLFRRMFDGLKANGAKYDVIGMSLYPSPSNWSSLDSQCLTNMQDMKSRYGKQVMICEIGMDWTAASTCKSFVQDIVTKAQSAGTLGVFYWEPETYGSWQGYTFGAFDDSGKPTVALQGFW
jgi:arabinogalactan endo-1,4-beta-galactosidase